MNSIACKPDNSPFELVNVTLPRRGVNNVITRVADTLSVWSQRSRQRQQLGNLDSRLLSDIGVAYEDIWLEIHKPFWKK